MSPRKSQPAQEQPAQENFNIEDIRNQVDSQALEDIAPTVKAPVMEKENVEKILQRLANYKYLTPTATFIAVALLFLKGAANKAAPDSMYVEVKAKDDTMIKVTKGDLFTYYKEITGNRFLRRMAEYLAPDIAAMAERNGLQGELAPKLETDLIDLGDETPLTPKEKAWANSFCQGVEGLERLASPRLKKLLYLDYQQRFGSKRPTPVKTKEKGPAKTKAKTKGGSAPKKKTT